MKLNRLWGKLAAVLPNGCPLCVELLAVTVVGSKRSRSPCYPRDWERGANDKCIILTVKAELLKKRIILFSYELPINIECQLFWNRIKVDTLHQRNR